MKLLLVLVTVIAVCTADGRPDTETANEDLHYHEEFNGHDEAEHFLDGSDGNRFDVIQDSTEQVRLMKERTLLTDDETKDQEFTDSVKILTQGSNLEGMKEQHKLKLRKTKPKCKANIACLILGGFCVTNTSLCSGRLVPEGCKKLNCQCCVPDTIDAKFDNLKKELQSLNGKLSSELQSLKVDMNNINSNLSSDLQSLTDNTNKMSSNLTSKLDSLLKYQGCPEGFFQLYASNQCFKFFDDLSVSWTAAKSKCQAEGLVLAKPFDPVGLRRYLVMRYGNKRSWISGRGTGSSVKWDRDGTTFDLTSSSPRWWPGHPGSYTSSSFCVVFASDEAHMNSKPNNPYYMTHCTGHLNPLCELLMG